MATDLYVCFSRVSLENGMCESPNTIDRLSPYTPSSVLETTHFSPWRVFILWYYSTQPVVHVPTCCVHQLLRIMRYSQRFQHISNDAMIANFDSVFINLWKLTNAIICMPFYLKYLLNLAALRLLTNWLTLLVWRPWLDPRTCHVGLAEEKVILGRVFSEYFHFPFQLSPMKFWNMSIWKM
jgi:hypothetical protein